MINDELSSIRPLGFPFNLKTNTKFMGWFTADGVKMARNNTKHFVDQNHFVSYK